VSSLRILCVSPLDYADELKRLFLAHDTPAFPECFDRAYPSVVRSGGKSWIGIDSEGHVVAHIARFPRRFALGKYTVAAGLLVDLMVAKSHRTFRPALALVRQMAANSKADADVDFLYGAPNAQAKGLFESTGFSTVGNLDRFVFPLADRRWYSDVFVQAYQRIVRIRNWSRAAEVVEHAAHGFDASAFERPAGETPFLRPFRPQELYRQCLADYPSNADYWFTFHLRRNASSPCAAVLVRGRSDRVATLMSLRREPSVPLSVIVPALAAALRRSGYRRLWVVTLSQTPLARQLMRVGFIPRHENRSVVACALTDLGTDTLGSAASWEITDLDCDW
jgi:hypothetical protein